jgi:hypothetical protein
VAAHVAMCDGCQRVKAEHQRPAGLLYPLKIPEWKWEEIGMDFITGLPRTSKGYDSIWVIMDRLTKVAHFIPVKTTYKVSQLAELYMARIVSLHGVPKKIILDRGSQFTPRFWKSFHENMDAKLNFSSVGVSTLGVPGPTSKLSPRAPAQMGRRETEREGGKKPEGDRRKRGNPWPSCLSRAQVGCACSRGLQASTREGARGLCERHPVLPRAANPL